MVADVQTYDIIFAGGGTVACVTAGRLAEADPSLKILIIEPGPHIQDLDNHVHPGRYITNMGSEKVFKHYVAKPSEALDGRQVTVSTGRCLGGGSAVNFMMYTRASGSDFDDWEKLGNPGWGSAELIPLARKLETYQAHGNEDLSTHGDAGPIQVSPGGHRTDIGDQFLAMAAKYDPERGFTDDVNDFKSCNAYGRWQKYIGHESGKRSDVANFYIYSQAKNKNLVVLNGKKVNRVVFKNHVAEGVECVDDIAGEGAPKTTTYKASRLVVLSAGGFGSPSILERSGIGAKHILEKCDIQQVVDLPGVGENYNDHNLFLPTYLVDEKSDSLKDIFEGNQVAIDGHLTMWRQGGRGMMAHNGIDAGIKIRPSAKDIAQLGSDFQKRWKSYYEPAPDKPLVWIGPAAAYLGITPDAKGRKLFNLLYIMSYPISTGYVHISSHNPYAPLDFDPAFLKDPVDVVAARWTYKQSREYARRMPAYRGEHLPDHPKFAANSAAVGKEAEGPVDIASPNIKYSEEDDRAIDTWLKATVSTTWHSLGTCSMKPREKMGVVDSRLNVYGVKNLKVADLSIAPGNVGANTYNTAMIIGEKAAVIFAADLGIKRVV